MKSGVKLRGHLGMVVKILDLIAKAPAQHRRELSRDREFVRMALSAENGVVEAIATVARHCELWTLASEPLEPVSFFKGSTAEYVFALAADGLKGLRSHHGQIRDGRLLPALTPEQVLFLNQIDVPGAPTAERGGLLLAATRRTARPWRSRQAGAIARPLVGSRPPLANTSGKRSGGA